MTDVINVFLPVILFGLYGIEFSRLRRKDVAGPCFYLTVFAAMSSNFALYYRQLGQLLVLGICIYAVLSIIRRRRAPGYNRIFAAMGLFIALSLLVNGVSGTSLAALVNFVAVVLIVNFVLLVVNDSERLHDFMRFYLRIALVLASVAIFEWATGGGRAEATFSNPNYLGFFLGPASCAALCLPVTRRRYLVWLILATGIYATGSRAALLFLPAGFLASLWIGGGFKKLVLIFMSILLMAAIALMPLPTAGREGVEGSDVERLTALEVGVQMTREKPLAGVGWGDFINEFRNYLNRAPSLFDSTVDVRITTHRDMVSHNDFARVFSELGIFAGCFFVGIAGIASWRAFRASPHLRGFLLATLAPSLVFSLTHNNLNNALFWLFLLLPFTPWTCKKPNDPPMGAQSRRTR